MKLDHYSEAELDVLARARSDSHTVAGDWRDEHLHVCDTCRAKAEFLCDYHTALAEVSGVAVHPGVTALAQSIRPPRGITLQPFSVPLRSDLFGAANHTVVLVAQSAPDAVERFVTLATFASEQPKAVVRVVEDRQRNELAFYLLPELAESRSLALIAFGGVPGLPLLLTDAAGVARVASPDETTDWNHASLLVRYPLAKFACPGGLRGEELLAAAGITLKTSTNGDALDLDIKASGEIVRYLAVRAADSAARILPVNDQRASLPVSAASGVREILIF